MLTNVQFMLTNVCSMTSFYIYQLHQIKIKGKFATDVREPNFVNSRERTLMGFGAHLHEVPLEVALYFMEFYADVRISDDS